MIGLSILFLLLSAQFLFVAQIIVYAGAVMVLFLFVIALLGPAREIARSRLRFQTWLSTLFVLALLGLIWAILFTIGTVGVLIRRNPLVILICIELMLNAVNLTLIAFSRQLLILEGQLC